MFHDALTTVPVSVVPLNGNNGLSDHPDGNDFNDSIDNLDDEIKPQKIKDNYLLGKFVLDPMATDFIGNPNTIQYIQFIQQQITNLFTNFSHS